MRPPAQQSNSTTGAPVVPLYLLTVFAYALLFTFWQVEPVPYHVHAMAVLVFATCLAPLFRWYAWGQPGLPMFELIVLAFAIQFSLPVYTQYNQMLIFSRYLPLTWQALFAALVLVELGVIGLIVGYYSMLHNPAVRRLPRLDLPFQPAQRTTYLRFALLGSSALMLLNLFGIRLFSDQFGAILLVLTNQFNVALIILAYQVYAHRQQHMRQLLYVAAGFAFIIGLTSGLLENALIPLLLVLLVRWQVSRRLPWRAMGAGLLLFLILNPAKHAYRSQIWYGKTSYSVSERVQLWTELATESATALLQSSRPEERATMVRDALARFDLIHKFAHVRTLTPAIIPYYQGDTYAYFLVAWIPRALWPGKPLESATHQLDVDYRLKYPWQRSTNIGIGLLPEAYANFGPLGMLLVMMFQGAVLGCLAIILNGPNSEGGRAIYLSLMIYFLNGIGTTAAILFGALWQQVLANALILRLFTGRFQITRDK